MPRSMGRRSSERRPLHSKVGVSQDTLSDKIAKVRRDDPGLSQRAAAGKAAGILGGMTGHTFKGRRKR